MIILLYKFCLLLYFATYFYCLCSNLLIILFFLINKKGNLMISCTESNSEVTFKTHEAYIIRITISITNNIYKQVLRNFKF